MKKLLMTLVFTGLLSSCETMNNDPSEAPEITNSMDFNEAYKLAVKHGKDTLIGFKKRVRHNREWRKLQKRTSYELERNYKTMSVSQLQRVAALYHLITPEISPVILKNMLRSPEKGIRKIGLQIAGLKPSPSVAKVLENTQRSVNISLINEVSVLFNKLNINTNEVLEAAEQAKEMDFPNETSLFSDIFKEKGNEIERDNC